MIAKLLLVGSGGFLGAMMRFGIQQALFKFNINFPVGTLLVNIVGSFILGLILFGLLRTNGSENVKLLFAIGFCGSLTTMSSFAFDNFELINNKSFLFATMNVVLNLFGCLSMIYLSKILIKIWFK